MAAVVERVLAGLDEDLLEYVTGLCEDTDDDDDLSCFSPHGAEFDAYKEYAHEAHVNYEPDIEGQKLMDGNVTINRPPRDGRMAFVRSPDGISIELLQEGEPLGSAEPWASMENTGEW